MKRRLRSSIGAHYGSTDWLIQRVSAVVMVIYTLVFLGIVLWNGGMDYAVWKRLFGDNLFRVTTFVVMLLLLWHAWVGARDIWMDYIKPVALRLTLETLTVLALIAYAGWTIQILWGVS